MATERPFVRLFKTACGHYMFDVNKNTILKISPKVYDVLNHEQGNDDGTYNCGKEEEDYISWIKDKGFLSSHKASEIIHPMNGIVENLLDNCVEKITLQITQMCNLKCRYCPYSGFGDSIAREHSNKVMSFETAKKAIDFLVSHSSNVPVICVGFYGGEPLMEFDLVKRCIEYATEIAVGRKIRFSMTTNATLLNEGIISFLQKYDVQLMVSLDGPREVHDKNRRFAANGSGTYDKIIENMQKFSTSYPEYFKKVTFNAVIDPANDLGCTNEFFMSFDMLLNENFSSSYVDNKFSREKDHVSEQFVIDYNYEIFKVYLNIVGKMDKNHISPIMYQQYISSMKPTKVLKPDTSLPEKIHHGGPCVAGSSKLFIDVNGRFLPCERVNEKSEVMIIGNVDSGFDYDKVRALINIGKLTEKECIDCWAVRYCTLCAAFADNMDSLSGDIKRTHCKNVRNSTEEVFKNYVTLKEYSSNINI